MHFTTPLAILATLSLALASPLEMEKRTTGQITYYDASAGISACGANNGGKLVAALSPSAFSAAKCGKSIKVTNSANGKSVTVKVGDKCAGCVGFFFSVFFCFSFLPAFEDVDIHMTLFGTFSFERERAREWKGKADLIVLGGRQSATHIDLSEVAFKKIGNTATGVLQGTWNYV